MHRSNKQTVTQQHRGGVGDWERQDGVADHNREERRCCWRWRSNKKGQRQMVSHLSMKMVRLPWEETGEGAASYWNQLRRHQWWWYWFAWERQGAGMKVAIKKGQGRRDDDDGGLWKWKEEEIGRGIWYRERRKQWKKNQEGMALCVL